MIVRILDEGQYELSDEAVASLEELDARLFEAIESSDEEAFSRTLETLLGRVRSAGRRLDEAQLVPSDLTLPHEGATVEDVRQLLESEPEAEPTERAPEGV